MPALERALAGQGPAVTPLGQDPGDDRIRAALSRELPLSESLPGTRPAVVLPTSGSTGEPKLVMLSAEALLASASATYERIGGPGAWLLALPATRVAGLQILVRSLVAGTSPVHLDGLGEFAAATERLAGAGRRYTSLVPVQLSRLLDAGVAAVDALRSYDAVLLGGAASSAALLERALAASVRVVTTYGMTETSGGCVYDGVPLDGVRIELGADGRVRIGGPVVFSGYLGRPDLTKEALADGFHVTQDLGRLTPDGRLEIVGRVDDTVISGGVNVPLQAVEAALAGLPGVAEAAAAGQPDPEWGARVVAYLVLRPGAEAPSLEAVRAQVAATHPRAYAPKEVHIVAALPLLPSGKLDRAALGQGRPPATQLS
ncbi:AMP-binding protein [Flindersiella endophytica]